MTNPDFIDLYPIEFCRRHQLLVASGTDGQQILYTITKQPAYLIDTIGRQLGQSIHTQQIEESELRQKINAAYETAASKRVASANEVSSLTELLLDADHTGRDDLLETDQLGPVVQLVNSLLLDAIAKGASDVHLQPFEKSMAVRMRIDGVLCDLNPIPKSIQEEVISRLKVAGSMNIAEKRLPQDGRATVCVGDRIIDLRLASMPTSFGERMVVRLLDKSARLYTLSELGMGAGVQERFDDVIHAEHGLVLVTGPTGSGKSTTLYAALNELDTDLLNAVTLEDPIEYQLSGVSQTQINTKKGMTFASGLRSVLRQDPDIIMVGEIRDNETAVMAIQAALTGHLVFSTLHTNDAASAVTRLLDLGIEPYLVSSSVLAVLAQRLVRRRCTHCGGPESGGCEQCRATGYRGRQGIYELLLVDQPVRHLITQRAAASEIRAAAVDSGMKLLREDGMRQVQAGVTTEQEIDRVTRRSAVS
ncbi:MAG: GspE/PulE family protein [Novipirellula sp. JB048]